MLRLLENLFKNSVEHGGGCVDIFVGVEDDYIYIEDNGSGIPENELNEVFSRGFTTRSDGSGLGLSIVKSIASSHGWKISAKNGDRGARFEIKPETDSVLN